MKRLFPINIDNILNCFKNTIPDKFKYLGYIDLIYPKDSEEYNIVLNFVKYVDKKVKPWYCPRFILNILQLIGNDNSVVRVPNRFFSNVHRVLTKGMHITDMKTKWDDYDLCIYGYFTEDIFKELEKTYYNIYLIGKNKGELNKF